MKKRLFNVILIVSILLNKFTVISTANYTNIKENSIIETSKKVRVGYYSGDDNFQKGFDDSSRKSGYAYEYYQAISDITGWVYEYVYGSKEEILELLENDEIDITAGIFKTEKLKNKPYFSDYDMGIGGTNKYFVVSAKRKDLINELNNAMQQISDFTPDYTATLLKKYYTQITQQELTDIEMKWLQEKGKLKIGYIKYHTPISEQGEDGKPKGVVKDLIDILSQYMEIEIEPVCYDNIILMEEGLKNHEIDASFPIYSDQWINETRGFRQTESFFNDRVMIVYTGNYTDDLMNKVALSRKGIGQRYYMEINYPNSKITFYNSRNEAFEAVQKGKERCIIGCSSTLQYFLRNHPEYNNLNVAYLDTSESFGMAVRNEDSLLLGILNKAIRQMDNSIITSSMIKYSDTSDDYTITDIIQRYSVIIVTISVLFGTFLAIIFILYHRKTRKFKKEQSKTNKALENALQNANSASKAKTNFLSSMSHDTRTPMNAIIGMTNIAYKYLDNKEKVADCLDKINLSSMHLLTLINNVLDISKIESGKLQLKPIVFSIRKTIDTILDIVQSQIDLKDINFKIDIDNLEYEFLYGDEVRINQIFMNILTNSIKYTNDGGNISMTLSNKLMPDEKTVCVTYIVEDNGIGMSTEFMENMYNTFTRAEDDKISEIQGTGLGLAIVKEIIEMMDGEIDCVSAEGKGTKFTVTLNLPVMNVNNETIEDAIEAQDILEDSKSNVLEGKHILIAEDNDLNWEIISELLSEYNITIDRAEDGQVCVDMLTSATPGTYDLILMDIQMPVMDGREATKVIRKNEHDYIKNIPIIAMTADAFAEDVVASMKIGMNGYISKPIDMNKLFQEMVKVLQN